MDFKLPTIVLVMIVVLVAFGPVLFFVPRLTVLRRRGILEYDVLGQMHSAEFHEKWIQHREWHESEFLQASEITTLANFGKTYKKIEQLNPFPADKGAIYTLAAAILIPAVPVVLTQIPLVVILKDLLSALR